MSLCPKCVRAVWIVGGPVLTVCKLQGIQSVGDEVMTIHSKTFIPIGVSAVGRLSLRPVTVDFFCRGTMVVHLKQTVMVVWARDRLKMSVNTSNSSEE